MMKTSVCTFFILLLLVIPKELFAVNWDKLLVAYETGDTAKINKKYTIAVSGVYAFVGDKKREVVVVKYDGTTWIPYQILKPTTRKRSHFGRKISVWNDMVMIEAPREGKNGAIYVYRFVNNRWRRVQKKMNPPRRAVVAAPVKSRTVW
jgi:hypothetical protein